MRLSETKSLAVVTAIALILSLVMVAVPTYSSAQQWYEVGTRNGFVEMHSQPGIKGKLKCNIPNGERVHHMNEEMISNDGWFIFVVWKKRLGTSEGHWQDARGRWCPIWDRFGWVHLNRVQKVDPPEGVWIR